MIKKTSIIYITFLLINIIAGLLLSCYVPFNMIMNSVVLLIAIGFVTWSNKEIADSAFQISLSLIIPIFTLVEFVIGLFSPNKFQDNWGIIAILCCIALEFILIFSVIRKTKSINN